MVCFEFSDLCASPPQCPLHRSQICWRLTFPHVPLISFFKASFRRGCINYVLLYSTPFSLLAFSHQPIDAPVLDLMQQSSMDPTSPSSFVFKAYQNIFWPNGIFYLERYIQNISTSSQYKIINKIFDIFHIKYFKSGYILYLRHMSVQMWNFQWFK